MVESKAQLRRATRTRKIVGLITSFLLLVAVVFLILVEIGNTYDRSVLRDTYWLRLDLQNIVPDTVPNYQLLNTIAQTVGLHDYYQFGLWNYCEGYVSEGITQCSKPETFFWFDVVSIIQGQLLAGATITLPTDATRYLNILETASKWMWILFLIGTCLTFVLIFLVPLNIYSRWASFALLVFVVINAILVCVGTAIGTAISIIFKNAITSFEDLNIQANTGTQMFVFSWIASVCTLITVILQFAMCCCCASRRDVRTGRKRGSKHAYSMDSVEKGPLDAPLKPNDAPRRGFMGRFRKNKV